MEALPTIPTAEVDSPHNDFCDIMRFFIHASELDQDTAATSNNTYSTKYKISKLFDFTKEHWMEAQHCSAV